MLKNLIRLLKYSVKAMEAMGKMEEKEKAKEKPNKMNQAYLRKQLSPRLRGQHSFCRVLQCYFPTPFLLLPLDLPPLKAKP